MKWVEFKPYVFFYEISSRGKHFFHLVSLFLCFLSKLRRKIGRYRHYNFWLKMFLTLRQCCLTFLHLTKWFPSNFEIRVVLTFDHKNGRLALAETKFCFAYCHWYVNMDILKALFPPKWKLHSSSSRQVLPPPVFQDNKKAKIRFTKWTFSF